MKTRKGDFVAPKVGSSEHINRMGMQSHPTNHNFGRIVIPKRSGSKQVATSMLMMGNGDVMVRNSACREHINALVCIESVLFH